MAFTIQAAALDPHNGLATDGLTCDAFNEETWFPSSSPALNDAEPGTPDATGTSGPSNGVNGQFLITVPTSGSYWVACYNDWDPTVIGWVKVLSHPHTQLQTLTALNELHSTAQVSLVQPCDCGRKQRGDASGRRRRHQCQFDHRIPNRAGILRS